MLYTEKMLQKEIDRRLYDESERYHNSRRFDQIEHEMYELRVAVEKAHARIDAIIENKQDAERFVHTRGDA